MNNSSKAPDNDLRPWARPGVGVAVERRDPWELARHGARAGLLAGATLGLVEIAASTMLRHRSVLAINDLPAYITPPGD